MPAVTYALQCEILRVKYRCCYDSAESVTRTHALLVKTKPSSWQRLISRFPLRGWESVEVGCTHLILSPLICICVTPVTAFFLRDGSGSRLRCLFPLHCLDAIFQWKPVDRKTQRSQKTAEIEIPQTAVFNRNYYGWRQQLLPPCRRYIVLQQSNAVGLNACLRAVVYRITHQLKCTVCVRNFIFPHFN